MPDTVRGELHKSKAETTMPTEQVDNYMHYLKCWIEDAVSKSTILESVARRKYLQSRIEDFLVNNPPPVSPLEFCSTVETHVKDTWKRIVSLDRQGRYYGNEVLMPASDYRKLKHNLTNILEKKQIKL